MKGIFERSGAPDEIYTWYSEYGGYEFYVVFERSGMVLDFYGGSEEINKACLNMGDDITRYEIILTNTNSGLEIMPDEPARPTSWSYFPTVEDVYEITPEEFYERMISDDEACFDVKNQLNPVQ